MLHLAIIAGVVLACLASVISVKYLAPNTPVEQEVDQIADEVIKTETGVDLKLNTQK